MLVPYTYRRFGRTSKEDGLLQSVAFFAKVLVMIAFLPFAHKSKDWRRSLPQSHQQEQPRSSDPESGESETTPLLASAGDRVAPSTLTWSRPWAAWTARYLMEACFAQIGLLSFTIASVLYGAATRALSKQWHPKHVRNTIPAHANRAPVPGRDHARDFPVMHSLAFIVAPILFNAVYAATVGVADGAVYYMSTSIWTIALALSLVVQRKDLVPRRPDAVLDSASVARGNRGREYD
ncbi:hypothetical protein AMAG_03765 [Allomyces macrogynus ATCC 38327]|uniref:Uncharacterized protein n=1 Tax=Allomyces macrogynus (strain ATCC 38327) TaxID=578462 RepID=A0A0L0SAT1_ALLM3|nr:hypothetical protein AMAG_03765 [Allomyces macrogynus ATCC 38327]|eukprot:KNE59490.1 hypothetical protein AMAG_03765 [Allomyces macrogynus ATCC 38327]